LQKRKKAFIGLRLGPGGGATADTLLVAAVSPPVDGAVPPEMEGADEANDAEWTMVLVVASISSILYF